MENEKSTKKTTSKRSSTKNEVVKVKAKTPAKKATEKKEVVKKVESKPKKNVNTVIQEENHYGRTLLAAFLIVIIFLGGYLAVQYKKHQDETNYVATADEKKFKEEYESINGKTRANGEVNKDVTIMEDNNITYISLKEASELLDSGSGVIYFGFAACPWCRNAVPVLLNAMHSSELDKIYYVDLRPSDEAEKDLRETYVLNNRNKAEQSREGAEGYEQVKLALANNLEDYILTTDKGKSVNTGQKRLVAPTVVAVKDGVVVGFHQGTLEGHNRVDGVLENLTKEQETDLLKIYTELISKYLDADCDGTNGDC